MAQRTSPDMIEIPDGVTHVALESWERGTSERGIVWDRTGLDRDSGEWGTEIDQWDGDREDVVNHLESAYGFTMSPWVPVPLEGLNEHMCEGSRGADLIVEVISDSVGPFFSAYRADSTGLTVQDVADRMGVSAGQVLALESGESDPTLSQIRRYALAVGARLKFTVTEKES